MKKLVTFLFIIITLVISKQMVFTKSFTPPAARTGAPGESTCSTGCHEGASGTGGTIDFGGSLTEYELSKTYTITITGENGTENGFELVSLRDSDNTNIGTITVTNTTNTTTQLSGGKTYISHKSASSNNSWSFDWTSPSVNEGNITFYVAVNKANGDGTFDGDLIYTNSLTINSSVTGMEFALNQEKGFTVYPNPVHHYLNISDRNNFKIKNVSIYDVNGKNVLSVEHFNNYQKINISDLNAGIYFLIANSEQGSFSKKIIKQ